MSGISQQAREEVGAIRQDLRLVLQYPSPRALAIIKDGLSPEGQALVDLAHSCVKSGRSPDQCLEQVLDGQGSTRAQGPELIKAKCPIGVGRFGEQCYIRPEDYDDFFDEAKSGAPACPESKGEEDCRKIIAAQAEEGDGVLNQWKKGRFGSGVTGFGFGYYGADQVMDGETSRRWRGVGANLSLSHEALIWGIANATLSTAMPTWVLATELKPTEA